MKIKSRLLCACCCACHPRLQAASRLGLKGAAAGKAAANGAQECGCRRAGRWRRCAGRRPGRGLVQTHRAPTKAHILLGRACKAARQFLLEPLPITVCSSTIFDGLPQFKMGTTRRGQAHAFSNIAPNCNRTRDSKKGRSALDGAGRGKHLQWQTGWVLQPAGQLLHARLLLQLQRPAEPRLAAPPGHLQIEVRGAAPLSPQMSLPLPWLPVVTNAKHPSIQS